jgi:hypothetical protein
LGGLICWWRKGEFSVGLQEMDVIVGVNVNM